MGEKNCTSSSADPTVRRAPDGMSKTSSSAVGRCSSPGNGTRTVCSTGAEPWAGADSTSGSWRTARWSIRWVTTRSERGDQHATGGTGVPLRRSVRPVADVSGVPA